jgi:hypothetical protein
MPVLSLPLGHHAALRERVRKFTDALVHATPSIAGIDPSIMVDPRRLSFLLAPMTLDDTTLPQARELLTSLRPRLLDMIAASTESTGKLQAPLTSFRVLRPYGDDPRTTNVLLLGPHRTGNVWKPLWSVASEYGFSFRPCDVFLALVVAEVHKTFSEAGLVDANRKIPKVCPRISLPSQRITFTFHPSISISVHLGLSRFVLLISLLTWLTCSNRFIQPS